MPRRTHSPKSNGHAGPNGRPNGHALASVEGSAGPAHPAHAASDDASGIPAATAPAAAAVAGTAREAYAAAAPPPPPRVPRDASQTAIAATRANTGQEEVPPGECPLPEDPAEFVEEIHSRIDLFKIWQGLLRSKDDKLRQRAIEKLTEMRYKGIAALADEPQQIIIDMPGPNRD